MTPTTGPLSAGRFWLALLGIVLLCDAWVVLSEPRVPARVMTKWTADRATSFMTRDEWIHWAVFFVTVPSLVVGAGLRAATRRWPHLIRPRLAAMSSPVRAKLLPAVESEPLIMAGVIALWFTAFHHRPRERDVTPEWGDVAGALVDARAPRGCGHRHADPSPPLVSMTPPIWPDA